MAIDSTTDLLFRIGANSDDAQTNVARFRTLLGKDLQSIETEFGEWASKTFGAFSTVQGAMLGTAAAVGAGFIAIGAAVNHATDKYVEYVSEVGHASKVTGIAVGDMSTLKVAADRTGTGFEQLQKGLTFFSTLVVKAAQGGKEQAATLHQLGLTQDQIANGEKNLYPLLEITADRFANLKSKTDQTAMARELFSRGGPEMLGMLRQGSDGLRRMADEAERLGLKLTAADVEAVKQFRLTKKEIEEWEQALEVTTGRATISWRTFWETIKAATKVALTSGDLRPEAFVGRWATAFQQIGDSVRSAAKGMHALGEGEALKPVPAKTLESYEGLTKLLETVRGELAAMDSDEAKAEAQIAKLLRESGDAIEELKKKSAKGDLEPGVFDREVKAWEQLAETLPALHDQLLKKIAAQQRQSEADATAELRRRIRSEQDQTLEVRMEGWNEEMVALQNKLAKETTFNAENQDLAAQLDAAGQARLRTQQANADREASAQLDRRLRAQQERTLQSQHDAFDDQINDLWIEYATQGRVIKENEDKIAAMRAEGHRKIDADAKAAYDTEIARLREQMVRIQSEHMTAAERVAAQYDADVAKFNAAEERKALALAASEEQRASITRSFADIRAALLGKEAQDLEALKNSVGWRGVFGSEFAQMIRGNEALTKEWANSTNQSLMLVRVTAEGLRETGQRAFQGLAQGMGQNIAAAIVYKKSIGEAMRAALASTLETISAEAITWAIYSTALGFLRLAQHDYSGAGAAFTSAAIWGSVGVAAGIAGRAIAPSQAGAAAGGAGPAVAGGGSVAAGDSGAAQAQPQPHVTVYVQGHLVGWANVGELTAAINDAVINRDVPLTASNTTTGKVIRR